jgi:iron complex transport system permease protein
LLTALLAAASVCSAGLIGFVGLMIPHLLRVLIGADHRYLLPASFMGGGMFLCLADTLARVLVPPTEMPVGILTAVCGVPFFLYLTRRQAGGGRHG